MYDIIAIIPGGRPTWAPLRFQPFAGEGDGCRAGHVDVAVLFVVFDVQRAQVELDVDAAASEAVQEGADGAGAGAGTAGQGLSGTPFPDAHAYMSRVHELHEFGIGAAGEPGVLVLRGKAL